MGICTCNKREDEAKIYLDYIKSLKIKTIKSEDLIKKLKEKYITVTKEEKKKSVLYSEILPLLESSIPDYREYSHTYFNSYFDERKKDFYPLALFCDKESNFKKTFDEITNMNRKEWLKYYSDDKTKIDKTFLKEIVSSYISFSTIGTLNIIEKISGNSTTTTYLKDLFDLETRNSILLDLFQPFEDTINDIDIDQFFKSETFKNKILNHEEILKMFLTYNSLKSGKK